MWNAKLDPWLCAMAKGFHPKDVAAAKGDKRRAFGRDESTTSRTNAQRPSNWKRTKRSRSSIRMARPMQGGGVYLAWLRFGRKSQCFIVEITSNCYLDVTQIATY